METNTLTQDPPLLTVLQECNDNQHLNPVTNFAAWEECLQGVYDSRTTKPTAAEYGNAIYAVWNGVLTRAIFSNALFNITNNGVPVYVPVDVYSSVNTYYPITLTITVDTTSTIQQGYAVVTVVDDNADPVQGSNEITVNAKVGNTLIWNAISLNGADIINLSEFVYGGDNQLFAAGEPHKNQNGSWQGVLINTGYEVYHFNLSINNSPRIYAWDPFINCIQ